MKKQFQQCGFTLVEVTITISVLVILAGIAVPSYRNLMESNLVRAQSSMLFGAFVTARTEAIGRNQPVIICTSTNGVNCSGSQEWEDGWLIYVDANSNASIDPGDVIIQATHALKGGSSLRVNGTAKSNVAYQIDGSLTAAESFNLCVNDDASKGASISVSIIGRPNQTKGAVTCPG